MGMLIVIAGTPGTGKTSVSRELSLITGLPVVDLGSFALEKGFIVDFDYERNSYVVDEDALSQSIVELASKSESDLIVSTLYPEILKPEIVRYVFVLRTHPLILEKRLEAKNWSRRKINENIMAEILGVVSYNAVEAFGEEKVFEVDTSNTTPREAAEMISRIMSGVEAVKPGVRVDWLLLLPVEVVSRFKDYE
ncbi:MAG: adenylate kinase family protein [Desulfurococcus sp.]|nr:adenylate kinase family protein [Desulfurococcus sp.]